MARLWGRRLFLIVAWLFVVGLIVQVYLAGMGVFTGSFVTHRDVGYMVTLLPVLLIVFGALGRVGRRDIVLSVVLLLQGFLQSILVLQRSSAPPIAALHPVNGVVMLGIGIYLGIDAWRMLGAGDEPAPSSPTA